MMMMTKIVMMKIMIMMEMLKVALDALLEEIPKMFADTKITEVVLGPVIQAGMDALKAAGFLPPSPGLPLLL